MIAALLRAQAYGVSVRFADLGDWTPAELRAEYDPAIPEIRINIRVAATLSRKELGDFVALAVGHELYHHRERVGEITVIGDRCARERAAASFARELMDGAA